MFSLSKVRIFLALALMAIPVLAHGATIGTTRIAVGKATIKQAVPSLISENYKDGTQVVKTPGKVVMIPKAWTLQNSGRRWKDCTLRPVGKSGLLCEAKITVDETGPKEYATIATIVTIPADLPAGTYRQIFKLYDADGNPLYPQSDGVWIEIEVIEKK